MVAKAVKVECGVCDVASSDFSHVDFDPEWDGAGFTVGRCCSGYATGRRLLVCLVLGAVERRLVRGVKDVASRREALLRVERLGQVIDTGRPRPGDPHEKNLIKWAKKLGIESRWLEENG